MLIFYLSYIKAVILFNYGTTSFAVGHHYCNKVFCLVFNKSAITKHNIILNLIIHDTRVKFQNLTFQAFKSYYCIVITLHYHYCPYNRYDSLRVCMKKTKVCRRYRTPSLVILSCRNRF